VYTARASQISSRSPVCAPAACLLAAQYFSKVNYIIDSVKMHGVYPPPAPKLCKNSLPEALAISPSSTPRQRQIKLGAASSLGQLADAFWLVGHTGLVFHTGAQAAAAASLREGGE
tara:strand:+ start:175 stop:522 length:348 start_codon:yes stop_codon:yes gene_type:complete